MLQHPASIESTHRQNLHLFFKDWFFLSSVAAWTPKKVDGRVRLDTENNFKTKSKKIVRVVAEIFSVKNHLLVPGVPPSACKTILEILVTFTKSLTCGQIFIKEHTILWFHYNGILFISTGSPLLRAPICSNSKTLTGRDSMIFHDWRNNLIYTCGQANRNVRIYLWKLDFTKREFHSSDELLKAQKTFVLMRAKVYLFEAQKDRDSLLSLRWPDKPLWDLWFDNDSCIFGPSGNQLVLRTISF